MFVLFVNNSLVINSIKMKQAILLNIIRMINPKQSTLVIFGKILDKTFFLG